MAKNITLTLKQAEKIVKHKDCTIDYYNIIICYKCPANNNPDCLKNLIKLANKTTLFKKLKSWKKL